MPLLPPVLINALINIDEPEPPKTSLATAEAWFQAWWSYASQMAHWNPATLPAVEQVVKPAFIGVLLPGCVPNPVPGVFYVTLELACIAGWLAGGAIPGSLLPTFIPASFVPPPVPGALAVALLPTVPLGLASPTKHPVRAAIGTIIDVWSRLWMVMAPGSPPVPTPFL